MFTEKFLEVLGKEGVVAIVSCADNEAHVVNTWNTYLVQTSDGRLLIPAWAMRKTEKKRERPERTFLAGARAI